MPPVVNQANSYISTIKARQSYAVFNILYDQDLYVKDSTSTRLLASSYYQTVQPMCGGDQKVAKASLLLQGLFEITCTDGSGRREIFSMPPTQDFCSVFNGPVVGQSVRDPGGAFINLRNGGYSFQETFVNKQLSVIAPISANLVDFFSTPVACNFRQISDKLTLMNQIGEVFIAN